MQRCRETAALALEGMNLQPEVDDDLREINFGLWEGLSFEEVMRDYPMDAAILARFDRHFVFPQGEAISTFLARVQRAVERMLASSEGPILAFTHGGVITAAICQVLGLHPRKHLLFVTRHASLTSLLVFGKRGVLMGMNESGVA
jgi:broad specificity phosphatase PhoE